MIQDYKITSFPKTHSNLADNPSDTMTATQLKAWWDDAPEQLRVALSGLIDNLSSITASNSGAENIGSAPISGVSGATVYAQLADVKNQINQYSLGQIPDGSLTSVKLADSAVTAAKIANGVITTAKLAFDPNAINVNYKMHKSGTPNASNQYPITDYKRRSDNTLYLRITLSNPNGSGKFQTMTLQYYGNDGVTQTSSDTLTLTYDGSGTLTDVS